MLPAKCGFMSYEIVVEESCLLRIMQFVFIFGRRSHMWTTSYTHYSTQFPLVDLIPTCTNIDLI